MRSMQFAGKSIEISPNRVYNCAFLPIDNWQSFSEVMFLLLGGTGVGYSVQKHHVEKLIGRVGGKDRASRGVVSTTPLKNAKGVLGAEVPLQDVLPYLEPKSATAGIPV